MNFINRRGASGSIATSNRNKRRRCAMRLLLGAIAPIAAAMAPTAGAAVRLSSVASGAASVSQNGSVTNIRTTNNAILNFSQFDIAKGSTVDFIQPSIASRVLDRVNSAAPSTINGSLISNGAVYLINPAGVIFGAGSMVDVNRFYVAGSHMSDSDFLSGVDHFSGISGMVSNSGTIHANQVYMVGSQVINQGSIVSPGGVVAMMSGSDVMVSEAGSHVEATVVPIVSTSSAGAKQTDLRASPMAAGDAYSLAIRHTGSIQASNVVINGGGGQVQVSGSINASNGNVGGNVSITGGEVDLVSAIINASGPAGGGTVLVGGGARGGGDLAHATFVSVDANSTIDADATSNGNGGTIVLWSDGRTVGNGILTARGGPLGGNGGYIETSGPELQIDGSPNASAPNGKAGSWVLDPATVEIVLSTGDGLTTFNASDIATSLDGGTSVTLTATGTLSQDSNAPISVTSTGASSLVLQGGADITLQGGISTTAGSSALNVEVDQLNNTSNAVNISAAININGTLNVFGGNVTTSAALTAAAITIGSGTASTGQALTTGAISIGSPVTTAGGSFTAIGTSFTSSAAISDGGGATGVGVLSVNTTTGGATGTLNIGAPISWTGATGRNVTLEAGGPLLIPAGGGITATGSGALPVSLYTTGSGMAVTVGGAINTPAGAFISSGGNFTISNPGTPATVLTAASGSINTATAAADGKAVTNGTITISGPVSMGGPLTLGGTTSFIDNQTGTITMTALGALTISTPGLISIGEPIVTDGGDFTCTLATSFTTTGSGTITTAGGNVSITTSTSSGISIGNEINTGGGSLTAIGQSFTSSATMTDGGVGTTASLSLTINTTSGTGAVSINDPVTWTEGSAANGRTILIASGGGITIGANGSITGSGAVPVTMYSTSASAGITLTGTVTTGGDFVASGGNFTITDPTVTPAPASLTAGTITINNTSTVAVGGSTLTLTPGTVAFAGPVVSSGTIAIGGITSFIENQQSSITSAGNITINNTGIIAIGEPVNTHGGDFIEVNGSTFTTSFDGTITTDGGNVSLSPNNTTDISIGNQVNTGGGAFTATAAGFEDTANISDGGVATAGNAFSIDTSAGTDDDTELNISWTPGTGRTVSIVGGANITVNSITQSGSGTLPVTMTTPATVLINATTSTNTITINGPISITGEYQASTGGFSLSTGGSLSTNGGTIQVTASSAVLIEGAVASNGGQIDISSGTTFGTDSNGTISSTGGDISLVGGGAVSIGAAITTGGGNFVTTGTTVSTSAEISDGAVNDSKAQGLAITATSGDITVGGDISWASSFSPVTFIVPTGASLDLGATITANAAEPINLAGMPVALTGTGALIGGNITLGALTNADSSGTPTLTIESAGAVSLQAVGTSASPFGQLVISANGAAVTPVTTLNGDIFAEGNLDFTGKVILPANRTFTLSQDANVAEFDGTVEGPGGLTIAFPQEGEVSPDIIFNGNVGDVTPVGFVDLTPGAFGLVAFRRGTGQTPPGVTEPQPLTTVNIASGGYFKINDITPAIRSANFLELFASIDSYGPLAVNIGTGSSPNSSNLYAVGQGEKLSVYGAVTINTNGGTISTGDISSIGSMTLDAANIQFLLRGPSIINSTAVDAGVDLIAGGLMTFSSGANITAVSGNPTAGSFDVPGFIAQGFATSVNISSLASRLKTAFSIVGGLDPSVLFGPGNFLLDLTPNTLSATVPTFVPPTPFVFDYPIAGAAPWQQLVAGTVPFDFKLAYPPVVPGPYIEQDLKDSGVYTRDPSDEEIAGAVSTMAVYDDMPNRPRPRASDYRVVVNRLDPNRAEKYVAQYKLVFGDDPQARKTQINSEIQSAWDAYVNQNGGQPNTAAGFAKYCATTPSAAKANEDLQQLHMLRTDLGDLALSYKEAQVAFQYNVLSGMSAVGMRSGDLAAAASDTASTPSK